MSTELLAALTVFALAILCGFAVISKVPATLHTPLMSGANSIHGIVLVGSMFIAASATDLLSQVLSFVAVAFATMNVVGGYVVTDRMLQMFRRKPTAAQGRGGRRREPEGLTVELVEALVRLVWLIGAAGFVVGLMRMNSPATARNGNLLSAGGMALAIGGDGGAARDPRASMAATGWIIIVAGIAVGGGLGLYMARTVKMTAMPQLVSLFNAVGGGAAALIAIDDYIRLASVQSLLPMSIPLEVSIPTVLDIVIGGITFTGSLIASGKLMGIISGQADQGPGRPARDPRAGARRRRRRGLPVGRQRQRARSCS